MEKISGIARNFLNSASANLLGDQENENYDINVTENIENIVDEKKCALQDMSLTMIAKRIFKKLLDMFKRDGNAALQIIPDVLAKSIHLISYCIFFIIGVYTFLVSLIVIPLVSRNDQKLETVVLLLTAQSVVLLITFWGIKNGYKNLSHAVSIYELGSIANKHKIR
jgi:hypothetical protein